MRKMILVALLLAGMAHAAQTFNQGGVTYVDAAEFARENGLTFTNQLGELTLTGRGKTMVLTGRQANVGGEVLALSAPVTNIQERIVVPLKDVQSAFGLDAPSASLPLPKSSSAPVVAPYPVPTAPPKSNLVVAPNGRFQLGGKEMPAKTITVNGHRVFSVNEDMGPDVFEPDWLDATYRLDGTPLVPQAIINICQLEIRNSLKSPSTYVFISGKLAVYRNKSWGSIGEFDAQNSYGALVRGDFSCFMRVNGKVLEVVTSVTTRR